MRGFRLAELFGMPRETRSDSRSHGSITREVAFLSLWWNSGSSDMVVLKVIRPTDFEVPYPYCREKVAYIHRLHTLIPECEAGALHRIYRAPSLHWVLLGRDIDPAAHRKILGRDKKIHPTRAIEMPSVRRVAGLHRILRYDQHLAACAVAQSSDNRPERGGGKVVQRCLLSHRSLSLVAGQ